MGKNRRYGSDLTAGALNEFLTRPAPVSLTEEERGAGPVTELPDGAPVDVWLRFRLDTTVQERAVVVAYTDRARLVELTRRDGTTYRVWVWAGAVTNLRPRRP
jgi:hypothetical protein